MNMKLNPNFDVKPFLKTTTNNSPKIDDRTFIVIGGEFKEVIRLTPWYHKPTTELIASYPIGMSPITGISNNGLGDQSTLFALVQMPHGGIIEVSIKCVTICAATEEVEGYW